MYLTEKGARLLDIKTFLSYTASLKDTKELLAKHGFDGASEKLFKASGVSALLDKKTSLSDVQVILFILLLHLSSKFFSKIQVYGRWKAPQTVLHYYDSSVSRRKEILNVLLS